MKCYTAIYFEDHQVDLFIGSWLDDKLCKDSIRDFIKIEILGYIGKDHIKEMYEQLNVFMTSDINLIKNRQFVFSSGTYITIFREDDIKGLDKALREEKLKRILK